MFFIIKSCVQEKLIDIPMQQCVDCKGRYNIVSMCVCVCGVEGGKCGLKTGQTWDYINLLYMKNLPMALCSFHM